MRDAMICEPLRTPVGRFGGMFREVSVTELATTVIKELVKRTRLPPEAIDDVLLGQGYPNGEVPALGRVASLDAGLPIDVPGLQIDRRCGSGLQAVIEARDPARRAGRACASIPRARGRRTRSRSVRAGDRSGGR